MQGQFKFRMSVVALGVMAALGSGQAMAADATQTVSVSSTVTVTGGVDLLNPGDGVYQDGNFLGSGTYTSVTNTTATSLNTSGTSTTTVGNGSATTTITGASVSINASINAATNINTGTNSAMVTIGNSANTTSINSLSNNIGVNAFATANNIGTNNVAASTNIIGSTNIGTTVTERGGNSTLSIANGTASLTAGSSLATNGTSGTTSATGSGGLTVYNSAQTVSSSVGGIVTGKSYQNKVNGNLFVDGNVYINGTLDYVSSNSANTSVIGATSATSNLVGATTATTAGTAIVMKGATGTQTVVDANGKLINVTGTATQSTAALTLTNGIGNTHGLVVTETQATLSGGTHSSSLTMSDNGATFSDSATGAPVQVHGVNDGTSDFDAVNVRQFASAIASVTAMANIPQVDQDKTVSVGMALGSFMGKTALAAGVTYRFTKNGVLKGSVSSAMNSSNSTAVGVGAAWSY